MYPEGAFINSSKDNLIVFEQDINNPENEGFVCFWNIKDDISRQLIFKKRLTKIKAIQKYNSLIKEGWKFYKETDQAA